MSHPPSPTTLSTHHRPRQRHHQHFHHHHHPHHHPPPPLPLAPSAAAATYATVCRALHISSRPHVLQALHTPRNSPGIFSARATADSDSSAIALSAALLSTHGATASLIRKFVTVFDPTACPTALSALRTAPTAHHHPPPPNSLHRRPVVFVDFSSSHALTPRAASAILAAVLLIPSSVSVELDLRSCPRLTTLSLQNWTHLLDAILGPPTTSTPSHRNGYCNHAVLSGLALDASPLRMLPHCTLSRLAGLRWLSMRSTRIRNLERVSDIVRGLPSLYAALFAGPDVDSIALDEMRRVVRMNDDSEVATSDIASGVRPPYTFSSSPPASYPDAEAGRWLLDENVQRAPGDSDVRPPLHEDSHKTVTRRGSVFDDGFNARLSLDRLFNMAGVVTPVTRSKHYRMFLLGHCTHHHLKWLDGSRVESHEFEEAREGVYKRFERVGDGPNSGGPSVMRLLRLRELGLCGRGTGLSGGGGGSGSGSGVGGGSSMTAGRRLPRPRKRKRVGDYVPRVPDVEAALVAAGFPVLSGREGKMLSTKTGITVALAAMASRGGGSAGVGVGAGGSSSRGIGSGLGSTGYGWSAVESMRQVEDALLYGRAEGSSGWGAAMGGDFVSRRSVGVFERYMGAALMGRSGAPRIGYMLQGNERPRQFEYNPGKQSELVYGTALGSLVVVDEDSGVVRGCCRIGGGPGHRRSGEVIGRRWNVDESVCRGVEMGRDKTTVFGLSWLNLQNNVFIAGTYDEGKMHVYNVEWMESGRGGGCMYSGYEFPNLTSITVNATDERFAVSGWSSNVGVFDVASGKRMEVIRRCHSDVINVIKFAHHQPHVLLTSSFDRCVRKWDLRERRADGGRRPIFTVESNSDTMTACFSPDDRWILVSAVDNEVRQYSAVDGRACWQFDIEGTGLNDNFTRSYYMLGMEDYYVISGSCRESVVRVFNGRTGKRLTTVDVGEALSVLSLRGNPRREMSFSALLFAEDESVDEVIASVDLHARAV